MSQPHFYRLRNETVVKDQVPGRATERCERDLLSLVLSISNSNAIRVMFPTEWRNVHGLRETTVHDPRSTQRQPFLVREIRD